MDLSTLDTKQAANAGAELNVSNPATGEPTDIFIVLAGADSDQFRAASHEISDRKLKIAVRTHGFKKLSSKLLEDEKIELLAKCTLSWRGLNFQGEELPCNFENAKMLYAKFPWLYEQVDQFIGDRANFLSQSENS